ncbi:hypothetical protein [Leptothoe sp. PORK10 BA2]|uniref:hypothetical protein n=1 Tax=Leptothoe sp. PORK10 BA2 TaxID=3110254 RepID=UPI002B1F19F3|nr:hypothetical protein [Leptothoe sp. PORK10 BA2]MEA5466166.1 hypothetical protein [Leptothoe sp. PORK10 BA2]
MKRFNTSAKVSGGVLTTVLVMSTPALATAPYQNSRLEIHASRVQTVIEEWSWRDMNI